MLLTVPPIVWPGSAVSEYVIASLFMSAALLMPNVPELRRIQRRSQNTGPLGIGVDKRIQSGDTIPKVEYEWMLRH